VPAFPPACVLQAALPGLPSQLAPSTRLMTAKPSSPDLMSCLCFFSPEPSRARLQPSAAAACQLHMQARAASALYHSEELQEALLAQEQARSPAERAQQDAHQELQR
jgi:hypothetical protein